MAGVFIEPQEAARFGLDAPAIEAATGRRVTAIWRDSGWFDNDVPELEPHAHGTPGYSKIMNSIETYFEYGQRSQQKHNKANEHSESPG